jgi:hypothetical protein
VVPAVAPGVVAVTLTGVLTVPELTLVTTNPAASEVAVEGLGVSVIPPTVVLNVNVTVLPLIGFPPVSTTLKITCEVSTPPVPFKEMAAGVAEINWIEPTVGAVTTRLVEADVTPATEALIASVPAQPLSRYEPVATPATVATPVDNTALPLLAQAEKNVTFCGVVTGEPPLDTVTAMLVVPNADSGAAPTPSTGAETVTAEAPTEKPIDPVTAVGGVPTWAVAVMVLAPAAARPAGFSVTVATPAALVKAVLAGVIVARFASVLKVMTALLTGAPAAFVNVAFTVAGAPVAMDVVGAPAASVSANVMVGTGVVAVVPPDAPVPEPEVPPDAAVPDETGVPPDPPEPQPARTASVTAKNSDAENLEISWLEKF